MKILLHMTHGGALCNFTTECFIIVSQELSPEVHLVTGCLAMPMPLRPVRMMAKSFKWSRQVQNPLTIPHYGLLYTVYHTKTGSTKANYSSFIPHENSVMAVTIIKRAVIVHATCYYYCLRLILQLVSYGVIRGGKLLPLCD